MYRMDRMGCSILSILIPVKHLLRRWTSRSATGPSWPSGALLNLKPLPDGPVLALSKIQGEDRQ
jgi:hypothetical protein